MQLLEVPNPTSCIAMGNEAALMLNCENAVMVFR